MKSLARRILGRLIGLVTGWPVDTPSSPGSDAFQPLQADEPEVERPPGQQPRSRLSPGAAEIQAELARQQLRGDAAERGRPRQVPHRRRTSRRRDTPRTGPRAGYSWGQSPGDRTRESTSPTPRPRVRPDRARPVLNRDRARRSNEHEVRRIRQTRRAIESKAAEVAKPPESRLSSEALEAQDTLVSEQLQRDAEARAVERPFREPLRNRTRIGPLQGILRPRATLPKRDRRVDYLVTAGFIVAAVIVGGATRHDLYDHSELPWVLAALLAAALVAILVLDYRRWFGSFPVRFTRAGVVLGLIFFIGISSVGRLGELPPVPMPDECSAESLSAKFNDQLSLPDLQHYSSAVERLTGRLRRPGRLTTDAERAETYRERGVARVWLDDPERALADYGRAIELDTSQVATYAARVDLFSTAECSERARQDLAEIQRIYSSTDEGEALLYASDQLLRAARVLFEPGYSRTALDAAGRAALLMAVPYEAKALQGRALASLGRLPEALVALTSSIELYRLNADGHFYRGLVNRRLGNSQAALEDFKNAVLRRARWVDARAALGISLFSAGRVDAGLEMLNDAFLQDESGTYAHFWRGMALLQSGRPLEAREDFRQAVLSDPGSANPYVGLAAAELTLGNREQAAVALAESRSRPVHWADLPTVHAWLENLERELGSLPSS